MDDIEGRVSKAISHFWRTRDKQSRSQGTSTGQRDAGLRTAATGGKQLDAFAELCRDLLIDAGLSQASVFWSTDITLPGFYRATKKWDLIVVTDGHLLAVIELKSLIGPSFGNNLNNRTEEALGSATDLWAAYREGAFSPSQRPWLGYVLILEDAAKSRRAVKVTEPHFPVFTEFHGASYAKRCELLLTKLLRERMYDGVSFLLTSREGGLRGEYSTPAKELNFRTFAAALTAHALAYVRIQK